MNKKVDLQKIVDSLEENFTEDALFLIQSYFSKLLNKMIESGVPYSKQHFILNGLYYYLNEYIEDFILQKHIINFSSTLDILNEIGSPTEIIQTLSFTKHSEINGIKNQENNLINEDFISYRSNASSAKHQETNNFIYCRYCQTSNEKTSNYCINCGKNLYSQENFSQTFKQDLIDHNYFITFILCWLSFVAVNVLFYDSFDTSTFALLFPEVHLRSWGISFPEDLAISMILSVIPAILTTIIGGYILDQLYFDKLKSPKQKYRQAIENLHDRFYLGVWLVVLAIFIFAFLLLNGFVEFMIPLMISIIIYAGMFWKQYLGGDQLHNLPYFKLLSTKKSLDNYIKDKYFLFSPISIFISAISAIIWTILGDFVLHQEFQIQHLVLVGGLVMIALFVLFNGFFFIYFYDWSYIRGYYERINMNGYHSQQIPFFNH